MTKTEGSIDTIVLIHGLVDDTLGVGALGYLVTRPEASPC